MNKIFYNILQERGGRNDDLREDKLAENEYQAKMLCKSDEYDEDLQRKYEKLSSSCGTNKE